jgi:hypothetical protein
MKTVALITPWNDRCGIAEYAKYLVQYLPKDIVVKIANIAEPNWSSIANEADILHFNYEPGLFPSLSASDILRLKGVKKTMMTLHTSHSGNNRTPLTSAFDLVVVHEKTLDGFYHIPHGVIPLSKKRPSSSMYGKPTIGTAGFPFPKKGFHQVVLTAKALEMACLIIAPESRHWDTHQVKEFLQKEWSKVTYDSRWYPAQLLLMHCVIVT